jgi:hypothetical protein
MGNDRASVHVLGVRHHGPGSARSVATALAELRPDAVLIEGPADAGPLLKLAAAEGMTPPVALLAYAADNPAHSAFWPFAVFSPEWQALTWALENEVDVRFCDLPAATVLAGGRSGSKSKKGDGKGEPDDEASGAEPADDEGSRAEPAEAVGANGDDVGDPELGEHLIDGEYADSSAVRMDPLAMLAFAAGYDDPERWWDDVIESRIAGPVEAARVAESGADGQISSAPELGSARVSESRVFEAITEAMAELRSVTPLPSWAEQQNEARREAYMRTQLRAVLAGGATNVVVVCGAWHAPALTGKLPSAAADARVLKGTPKRKVAITWVPWTHSRLSVASGYGAGVNSPGWYHHLFSHPDLTVVRWLTKVARVLRQEDLPVSSAHVIEAVRLADALATLRGRQLPGLDEVTEATRSVLVDGDDVALALVTSRLVVGEALGTVPEGTPTVPLEADLRAQARRLRLKFEAVDRTLDLDLRRDGDLTRSQLLHRLTLLDVPWGVPAESAVRATGTFRETWRLTWKPELSVSVIEAAMWGTTVEAAAIGRLRDVALGINRTPRNTAAGKEATLPELTEAVEACLLADLPTALPDLLRALDARAAVDLDLEHLTGALPALVRALRYGDVRGTDTSALGQVADAVLTRICVGLPQAVTSLDDTGSATLRTSIDAVHAAVALLDEPAGRERWLVALARVIDRNDVHGLLIGRLVRILRDAGRLSPGDASDRLSRALSVGTTAASKAAWVDGFFSGGGLLLVHDRELLGLLDDWISTLGDPEFVDVLPLLRRTFGQFAGSERRSIGERVRHGRALRPAADTDLDHARAARAMATVATLLGVGA